MNYYYFKTLVNKTHILYLMLHEISRLNVPTSMGLLVVVKTCEDEHTIKGDWGGPAKNPPMAKLVSSKNRVPTLLEVKSQNTHLP